MKGLRRSWIITAVVGTLFVVAVLSAIFESREALHYRETGRASTQLELAAHTLSMIELIEAPPAGVELEEADAVALLEDETAFARTGLNADEQTRAVQLVGGLVNNAEIDGQTEREEIEELLQILHDDAELAEQRGTEAETSAFRWILLSAITGVGIVWLVLSAQRRTRRLRQNLKEQAFTDFLTGLPNRRELAVCFDIAREEMERDDVLTALLYMDLDGFKEINDAGGHDTGDQILKVVAEKLSAATMSDNETLVRLGGDEFGVVVRNLESVEEARTVAERFRTSLSNNSGPGDVLHISVGLAVCDDVEMLSELQSQANLAMYEAKKRQGSSVTLYEERMSEAANMTAGLLLALRNAELDQEFSLEYQPVVAIDSDDVFFVEALLRWNSPSLGRVNPNDFIPLAESSGEIQRIGDWVIRSAFEQHVAWQDDALTRDLSISVNVSINQLEDDDFVVRLLSTASEFSSVDPSKLIIEVTESSASGSVVMERLAELRAAGYRVAIDDFGSGYSNLAQLIQTPFDILKIDRQLIASLEESDASGVTSIDVLAAIGAIARAQGAPVVCEGVEEQHQLAPLISAEISHIQGWLISKSVPADELRTFLAHNASVASAA